MMKRILKLAFLNTIQRRHIKQHQKNIEIFEQAFATIKSTTGISDIEEIVKIFVKLEERNFSLLTYVNQLNREIEALEKRNKELDSNIKDQRQAEEDAELRRRQELSDLDLQIQRTQASTQDNNETLNSHQEILTEVKPVVIYIAEKIDREGRGHSPLPREGQDDILSVLTWIEISLGKWREYVPEREGDKHFKPFPCTVAARSRRSPRRGSSSRRRSCGSRTCRARTSPRSPPTRAGRTARTRTPPRRTTSPGPGASRTCGRRRARPSRSGSSRS